MLLDLHLNGPDWKLEDFDQVMDDERIQEAVVQGEGAIQAVQVPGRWNAVDWKLCVCLVLIVVLVLKIW